MLNCVLSASNDLFQLLPRFINVYHGIFWYTWCYLGGFLRIINLRPLYWTSRPGLCYIVGCLALESVAVSGNWFPEEISYLSDEMTPVGSLTFSWAVTVLAIGDGDKDIYSLDGAIN